VAQLTPGYIFRLAEFRWLGCHNALAQPDAGRPF
jgi:hypothetical protein